MKLREEDMGEVLAKLTVRNVLDPTQSIESIALVDTGAAYLVLPAAWRDRLGELDVIEELEVELADAKRVPATLCGPVRVEIEGFRHTYSEVLFLAMEPTDGKYQPLIGHFVLQQARIAVDMVRHRLFPVASTPVKLSRARAG